MFCFFFYTRLSKVQISNDIGFETTFLTKWPVTAYLYDHTIDKIPPHQYPQLIRWHKEGISANKSNNLNTWSSHVLENHDNDKKCLMLKMDVEGAEWAILAETDDKVLKQFCQVVLEFHGLVSTNFETNYDVKIKALSKLNTLFHVIHLHGNNYSGGYRAKDYLVPDVLEVSYIRKGPQIKIKQSQTISPIAGLDYPNNSNVDDIKLNKPPFQPRLSH